MDINKLSQLKKTELLADESFSKAFIKLFVASKNGDEQQAAVHYDREAGFVIDAMYANNRLQNATTASLIALMLDLAYYNLSLAPVSKAQAYIVPRSYNKGTKESPNYEVRALLMISAYGELYLRQKNGIIKYADNPVMVYEGDDFSVINGKPNHTSYMNSNKITHSYIKIVRMDGSEDYKFFSMDQIQKYRSMSDSKNSTAWTGGKDGQPQIGMIEAKVIKHAFSSYPRINLGRSMIEETDEFAGEALYAQMMGGITENEIEENNETPSEVEENPEIPSKVGVQEDSEIPSEIGVVDDNEIPSFDF